MESIVLIFCGYVTGALSYGIILVNVGGTVVALILFLFNAEFWETPAHWIEYSVQMFVTLTSFAFIFGNQDKTGVLYKYRYHEAVLVIISFIISVFKLFVYGEVIELEIGGERGAHYFEYSGELLNDIFALTFTLIRYQSVQ